MTCLKILLTIKEAMVCGGQSLRTAMWWNISTSMMKAYCWNWIPGKILKAVKYSSKSREPLRSTLQLKSDAMNWSSARGSCSFWSLSQIRLHADSMQADAYILQQGAENDQPGRKRRGLLFWNATRRSEGGVSFLTREGRKFIDSYNA